jgi:hypothetical protein
MGWFVVSVVAVVFAGDSDGDADGGGVAVDLDQVEMVGGGDDPVTGVDVDGIGGTFDGPGEMALVDGPAFVGQMVVPVVLMTGRLADDGDDEVIIDDEAFVPGWGAMEPLHLLDCDLKLVRVEDRGFGGHRALLS